MPRAGHVSPDKGIVSLFLWPHNTLNKVASQATYSDLPTTGIAHKKDKITLPKAVAKENNRVQFRQFRRLEGHLREQRRE
jgi:hypothetical protein